MSQQLANYEVDELTGCWLFLGTLDKRDGGALIWRGNKPYAAYRASYELHDGPVPEGQLLDHGCERRRCIRPAHLEPVTPRENQLRRSWSYRCRIAKCKRGHSMATAIAVPGTNGRVCRECSKGAKP